MPPPMGLGLGLGLGESKPKGGAFTPASVADLVGWWDSDTGVAETGGNVTSWTDTFGNHMAANATPFTYETNAINGHAALVCSSVSVNLSMGTRIVSASSDRTTFIVFQSDGLFSGVDLLAFGGGAPSLVVRYFQSPTSTTSDESSYNNTGSYTPDANPHVICVTHSVGMADPYLIDGTVIAQAGATVSTADSGTDGFTIGSNLPLTANGLYASVLVYSRVLTADEVGKVNTYLMARYAVA